MTDSERNTFTGLQNVTESDRSTRAPRRSGVGAATAKDWRDHNAVTGVKDQGTFS